MHWSDRIAKKLLKRGKDHVIETGTSISGIPHIGNASDVIRGDAIIKVLREKGIIADLIWLADDSDPFRKVPREMESLSKYLGFPVKDIPDPNGCHKNFVEHFVTPFLNELNEFGVRPKAYSSTELYRSGAFYEEIKTALENSKKIAQILNKFREEPLPGDFLPWNPICEKCGRISTAKATGFHNDTVEYECKDTIVSDIKVEGCNYGGESDIRKGNGKLTWRVEWAARWHHFKVTCEPFGKEHATLGGSYSTSKIISKKIFKWEAPVPVVYEFFTLGGEKISSSKGNVITLGDWLKISEPEALKYFMYKRLEKQRDINLNLIPNMTDEYDEAEKIFFNIKKGSEKKKRTYQLAQVNEPKFLGIPFSLCTEIAQIPNLSEHILKEKLVFLGYNNFNTERLQRRIKVAREWINTIGPEHLRFSILPDDKIDSIKAQLTELQIKGLSSLADELEKKWTPKKLHKRIYEIARSLGLKPPELFDAIYSVLIGKKRGPRAASFILTLNKGFVQRRFKFK